MKNLIMLTFLFISLSVKAQNGIGRPVTGAHWNDGVEGTISKYIHNNINNSGSYKATIDSKVYTFEVEVLNEQQFVLFEEGYYANHNRNYIKIPNGKVWNYIGKSQQYLAQCGNKIEEIKSPKTVVVEKKVVVEKPDSCNSCEKLDRIEQNQKILMQDNIDLACMTQANMELQQLITRYNTAGVLEFYGNNRANRELEQLKQKYPCIPADMTIHRANKLLRDGLDILNLGLNTYTAIKVSQKPQVRYVNNRVIDNNGQTAPTNTGGNVDHNPNGGNVGGHNNNGNRTALVTNRGGAPIGYTYQQRLAMRNN